MTESVLTERHGRVALVTLNRPERLNAVTQQLWDELDAAFAEIEADVDVWAVVLTGAGDSFCAGADLGEIDRTGIGADVMKPPDRLYKQALGGLWKPVIAAINGYALAAGWWLVQSCDVRIAGVGSELGIPETRWNLRVDFVSDLTRIVGLGHALEIAIWGDRRISAQRAYEIGFVNKVVPDDQVLSEAMDWAERVCHLGPRSVSVIKQAIYQGWGAPTEEGSELAITLGAQLAEMADTREGPRAYLEKRPPLFMNR